MNGVYFTDTGKIEAHADIREYRLLQESVSLLDEAIKLIADWCDAIRDNGAGWDDWDSYYKKAAYGDGPLRKLIDAARKPKEKPQ